MNTKTIDCTGSNLRPTPVPLDGSPAKRPLRSALIITLALASLSMLAAFPGTASGQITAAKDCITRPTNDLGTWDSTCAHDVKLAGSATASSSCIARTGGTGEIPAGSTGTTSAAASPQTVCLEYKDAATQYSSGYAACSVSGCGSSGVTYSEAVQLPVATINPSSSLRVSEGSTATMSVSLEFSDSQATIASDIVINITSGDSDVTLSSTELTFTNANKSQAQTVTVSAAHDGDTTDDTPLITFTPASTSGAYAATTTVAVIVDDDDSTHSGARPPSAQTCIMGEMFNHNDQLVFTRINPLPDGCSTDAFTIKGISTGGFGGFVNSCRKHHDFDFESTTNRIALPTEDNQQNDPPSVFCFEYKDTAKQRASGYAFCPDQGDLGCEDNGPRYTTYRTKPFGRLIFNDGNFNDDRIAIIEGETFNINVEIDSLLVPTENVSVSISTAKSQFIIDDGSGNTDNTITLSFTPSTLSTAKAITVTSPQDDDEANVVDTLTFAIASSNMTIETRTFPIIVSDDDRPQGAIVTSGTGITLTEGNATTVSLYVHLTSSRPPDSNTVVNVTADNSDIIIDTDPTTDGDQSTLTFTPANYGTAQRVILNAKRDDDKTNDTGTITLSSEETSINLPSLTKQVTILEPPEATIETNPSGTFTIEEGLKAILKVKLSAKPTTKESTVRISNTNSDLTLDRNSLTFTPEATTDTDKSVYDEYQEIVFTAAYDADLTNDSDTITLVFADGGLNDVQELNLPTIIVEPPDSTIVVNPGANLQIHEGTEETIGVRLGAAPNANVIVRLRSADNEISIDTNPDAEDNQDTLTFTVQNYAVMQPVKITAAEDDGRDGSTDVITFSTSAGGVNSDDTTLNVEILDNDVPSGVIEVSPSNFAVREGFSGTLNVKLSNEPNRDVVIDVALSKIHSGVTISPETLTFTISDWDTVQTVIVSAARDRNTNNETNTITFSPSASGGLVAPNVIKSFNVYDAEISPAAAYRCVGYYELDGGGIGFGGHDSNGNSRFTCTAGNVRVYVNYLVNDSCSPQSHEITPGANGGREFDIQSSRINWCAEYSNSDIQRQSGFESCRTLSCPSADDSGHTMEIGSVIEAGGFDLSVDSIDLDEHERRSFDVMLESDPTLPVSIYLTSSDPHVSLDPQSLFFNRGNWFSSQTVTVTSEGDKDSDDHQGRISLEAVGGNYHGLRASLPLTVADNESTVAPNPNDALYWPVQSHAFAIPPVTAQDQATVRIRCRQNVPCIVYLDCSDQANGSLYRGMLSSRGQPVATIPAWGTRTLDTEDIVSITGRSWAGNGRLACAFRSHANIGSQVWTRSGEGVLVNNSDAIRSSLTNGTYQADIESIPAPGSEDDTNIRIRCSAVLGEHCTGTRLTCYGDDGTMHDGTVGTIRRFSVRHMQTSELSDIINHRWRGMGLSCEVTSDHPFSVQVLTRTGGGGALVNNSATGD